MRTIVSSKAFHEALKKAFKIECHCISISDDSIGFLTRRYQEDFYFHICKNYKQSNETIVFNNLKMARLMDFLKTIPEQPISIEIDSEGIGLEGVIVRF